MRHLLALFPIDRAAADRAAAIIASIDPRPLLRPAALLALIYVELVLFGIAMGGGQ